MMPERKLFAIALVGLWVGCSSVDGADPADGSFGLEDETKTGTEADADEPSKADAADAPAKTDGDESPAAGSSAPGASVPAASAGFDYEKQTVELTEDLVIPAGKTVRVGPGVTFHAAGNHKVQVLGTLEVAANKEAPSSFTGAGKPNSWHGIVVGKGGTLKLSHAKVGGAKYGIYAEAGSSFAVSDTLLDTSFKTAVIFSDGTFDNTRFTASAPPTIAITEGVAVDDPNGSLTIIDASPTIRNCRFDGASPFTDLVRIGGKSAPTFDHVYLHDAHCAFHTAGGTNTSARITNALMENFSYAFMAFETKPIVENSVFRGNFNDFGLCAGSEDNAPALKNNFYEGGEVRLDASCFRIATEDPSPAKTANPDAGAKL